MAEPQNDRPVETSPRWQFSLRTLFAAVTLTAVFFSLRAFFYSGISAGICVGLILFGWLAVRAAVTSSATTKTESPGRFRTSWRVWLFAVIGGLIGAWAIGVRELALMMHYIGSPFYDVVFPFLECLLGGAAIGASTVGLAALFSGGRLGRGFSLIFGIQFGFATAAWTLLAIVFCLPEDSLSDTTILRIIRSLFSSGIIIGIAHGYLLPGFGASTRRWAARGAGVITLVGAVVLGYRFVAGYFLFRNLRPESFVALAAAIWLIAILAGAAAALISALRGPWRLAFTIPLNRIRWPASGRKHRLIILLVLLFILAAVLVVPRRHRIARFCSRQESSLQHYAGVCDDWAEDRYDEYREQIVRENVRRQGVDLPPVDRAEVFALGEPDFCSTDNASAADSTNGFPIYPYDRFAPILAHDTVTGQEARDLAQMWRSRIFDPEGGALGHFHTYGLRFFSKGRMVLETTLCWQCANYYVLSDGQVYEWIAFYDEDYELIDRLQEIAPLTSEKQAYFITDRAGWLLYNDKHEEALAEFDRALATEPDYPRAYLGKASTYRKLGQLDKAAGEYGKLIKSYDKEDTYWLGMAYHSRGDIYVSQGKLQEAVADFSKAINLGEEEYHWDDLLDLYENRGLAYTALGRYQEAIDDFTKIISELEPDESVRYLQRAELYEAIGDQKRAKADRIRAGKIEEASREGYGGLMPELDELLEEEEESE